MLLIGSRAAKHWYDDFRKPNDWDIVASVLEVSEWVETQGKNIIRSKLRPDNKKLKVSTHKGDYEFELNSESGKIYEEANRDGPVIYHDEMTLLVARPTTLKLIKRSHVHLPIWWEKNINDYHYLKRKIRKAPSELELIANDLRVAETENRKLNLNKSNEEFFAQSSTLVARYYEHDDLHKATCYYDTPLFEKMKKNKEKAALCHSLFEKASAQNKIRLVREECYAIALERKIIPQIESGLPYDAERAFQHALERICTTLTSGWFREFAIENYPKIKEYDTDYVTKFLEAVESGKIRRKDQCAT